MAFENSASAIQKILKETLGLVFFGRTAVFGVYVAHYSVLFIFFLVAVWFFILFLCGFPDSDAIRFPEIENNEP